MSSEPTRNDLMEAVLGFPKKGKTFILTTICPVSRWTWETHYTAGVGVTKRTCIAKS